MKVRQDPRVTIRGSHSEKKFERVFEAVFVCVFLLSLFLTGCSNSMTAVPQAQGTRQVLQATAESTMPPTPNVLEGSNPTEPATTGANKNMIVGFANQDAVAERVRLVTGWLRFVRQTRAAAAVETGWDRIKSGKVVEPIDSSGVIQRPDISRAELALWRQILKSDAPMDNETAARLEILAEALTVATTPDDLMNADNLLVPETVAVY